MPVAAPESEDGAVLYLANMVTTRGPSSAAERNLPAAPPRWDGVVAATSTPDDARGVVESANASPPSILPIDVRGARPRDLVGLRWLDTFYRLNQPESHLAPYSVLRSGLRASLPGLRRARPTFVASAGDRLVGYGEFRSVGPDQRWLAIALGASVGVFDADPVWEALLLHAVRAAGLRGVKRLYARVPQAAPVDGVLRRLAWTPYAAETVFVGYDLADAASAHASGRAGRPQTPADTWAIHQLYAAAVPRAVQDAEAFTSHHWDLLGRRGGPAAKGAGWLIQDGHQVVGYARTASRTGVHLLELLYHPDRREVLDDLIVGALGSLPTGSVRRVYCAVRGYQTEAATALEDRGFVPTLEQDLLVRYTTATVRVPAVEAVSFHVEVRDKLPQRVPSFLHGRPRDGSAG